MTRSEGTGQRTTVTDASVLFNFLGLGRLELLTGLPRRAVLTPEVNAETRRNRAPLEAALAAGEIAIESPPLELADAALFARLARRLSLDDASCVVAAKVLGADLATDDRATRRAAADLLPAGALVGTEELLAEAVRARLMTLAEGDALLGELVKIKYRPSVASLRELLGHE